MNVKELSTSELVSAYNKLTGKSIKKFSSRAAGEAQMLKALKAKDTPVSVSDDTAKKAVKVKRERKPPQPKKTLAERAASISASWQDPKTRAARSQRTAVQVDGTVYRSVVMAFKELKLPKTKMVGFRVALKASAGRLKLEGTDYVFSVVSAKTAEKAAEKAA